MQDNSNLSVLVIDPNPGMRGSLQNMLVQSSITKIEFAVNASTAIKQVGKRSYDLILCEYDLDGGGGGDSGQDGQQLLEDMRHHKLIGLSTIFIMITSEGVYSKVVSAAELTPTDYILKPFTVDMLSQRINRAVERRAVFLPTYNLISQGNLREAIRSAATGEANHPRYVADFARLRADMHVALDELAQAEAIYSGILASKSIGWASLGLARVLFTQDKVEEAENVVTKLIEANPKFMAAYDLLAKCHEMNGAAYRAQKILEEAVAISPHMVRRLRRLGEVALEAGDVVVAEKSFKQVVSRSKYSEFRDPEDHVKLVKTLLKKGDTNQAGSVIRDMEKSLRGNAAIDACKAISVALLHESAGNTAAAVTELNAAVAAVRLSKGLSSELKIGLARTCLSNRLDNAAAEVMLTVMNDVDSDVSMQDAMSVFVKAGRPDLAEGMNSRLMTQVQELLDLSAEKGNMGDVKGAVQTLLEAQHMAPKNVQVMLALAKAILRQLEDLGWDHPLAEICNTQLDAIRKIDPANPLLPGLTEDYHSAQRKYGIST
ncbi:tetratricopeptide repeat protein [Massilia antarctica]|uniref:tetratricopeptide repeat protein n=1 Tax=Massilia antarctica TaxID=2765360 RepID=UPI0006BB7DD8|nr:response regulator [Massilia sp. H27-R4]MCY0914611.1 response regulator [Massilia sp. H27-R4]CUI02991.1 Chemotaxis regulator-transmits chemoreceptor signals to flagelllar motor components CheY [Janthinobacterium sp. CG23_2]CUU26777.1 Chemotaxis regulator-transmits chemoreceptor signals to flagelllar motor components CheY [Janthinobacterium sp. CG23_2]